MAQNPICWFEIYVQDMERARAFYEGVLGVKLEPLPGGMPDYFTFPSDMAAPGTSGAICRMDGVPSGGGGTLVYFSCEDVAVEAARVEAHGGKIFKPKFSIGEFGFIALAVDPDGNMIGLHSLA
ncbi:MAG TPA: VOC family protein [Holophaga sp.]|nr:VOC family protein [Holophaga sp.]